MATSGSTDFSVTRDDIISRALRIMGVTPQGISPSSTQTTEASMALNSLVKALEADGMPLWGITEYSMPMTSGTRSYRIGVGQLVNTPKPLKMLRVFRRHLASNTDTPMILVTRDEYDRLGNKFSSGVPVQAFYDPQRTYGDLYLFPTPDAVSESGYAIQLVYQRPFEDFDAAGDEPDFPQEWFDALAFLLADRLAPEYGLDKDARMDLRARAQQYKAEALSFGSEEGSFYFQVDRRYW